MRAGLREAIVVKISAEYRREGDIDGLVIGITGGKPGAASGAVGEDGDVGAVGEINVEVADEGAASGGRGDVQANFDADDGLAAGIDVKAAGEPGTAAVRDGTDGIVTGCPDGGSGSGGSGEEGGN